MTDNDFSKQQQLRADELVSLLRDHAARGTPWETVQLRIKRDFTQTDIASVINRLYPSALNLQLIYKGIMDKRY